MEEGLSNELKMSGIGAVLAEILIYVCMLGKMWQWQKKKKKWQWHSGCGWGGVAVNVMTV
jgi:hypothetical protein